MRYKYVLHDTCAGNSRHGSEDQLVLFHVARYSPASASERSRFPNGDGLPHSLEVALSGKRCNKIMSSRNYLFYKSQR